ncbi:MAG TPA: TIGR00282 family metallophosphoesterase [Candidatus Omnitrophota bacterium]|nr:TIGR00282 family metallophosphoesterase [Candidatus Omnitrophota bacterium]
MPDLIKILALGDTVGEPGRMACKILVPRFVEEGVDFVLVNGENLAGGSGITESTARELLNHGIDVITTGDHFFDKREAYDYLSREPRILRPLNYPAQALGHGSVVLETRKKKKIGVINLMGQVFMIPHGDSPFLKAQEEIRKMREETKVILVDIHAEATSEKIAMGWFLDGKVSAVFGSHTHVQTADERILPHGTAYITDMGMTGPHYSVLGRDIDSILNRFMTQMPARFSVASEDVRLCGVIFDVDPETGKAVQIKRIHERLC